MKRLLLPVMAIALVSFTYLVRNTATPGVMYSELARQNALAKKSRFSFACRPDLDLIADDQQADIPLLTGWGNYRMPVTASNDSSRIYFEQGINMYYAFHIIEALASFYKSTKFDNNFAMGYWGKALAYGPNINDFGYTASPEALTAMRKAKDLEANCSPYEKALIDAMQVRYSDDSSQSRAHLNEHYAEAMKKVYRQYPDKEDVAALYADALMVQHPWDFYDNVGKPKQWTAEIVEIIETLLKKDHSHPGAVHYYIHAIEASDHPEKGVAVARTLPQLMPGVAHVVHMPSHLFIRAGYYNEGVDVNAKSVQGYYNYLAKYSPVANNTPLYLIHNLHMQSACANMDGRYAAAMKASIDCKNSFDSSWTAMPGYFGIAVQYIYMTPYLTDIRFGKWDDILQSWPIADSLVFANLLWHYGRGMAFARKHDIARANSELRQLQEKMLNAQLKAEAPLYANEGISAARVAEKVLQGVIAEEQGRLNEAISILKEAVQREDAMKYNEPRDWLHPTRQYLGCVLLKAKRFSEAEKAYKEDLVINPHNGWSLTGLSIALAKENKSREAAVTKMAAQKAFSRSDVQIKESVF